MVAVPPRREEIAQTCSGNAEQQDSDSGSAEPVPSPLDRALLGMYYYLTKGLEGIEAQHYGCPQSFRTAIKLQADQLYSGNAGQYVVFSHVPRYLFANIEHFRDPYLNSLRFLYYESEQMLIVKIMAGPLHAMAVARFEGILTLKLDRMGLFDELCFMRDALYHGIGNGKKPDAAFRPRSSRPFATHWPTLIMECGVSQSLKRLRVDAHWWLTNSMGQVKIVLLLSISKKKRKIRIEQWEMGVPPNLEITDSRNEPNREVPECTRVIEIVEGNAGSASLPLSFQKLFLREPGAGEMDITFTTQDLEGLASYIWANNTTEQSGHRKPRPGQTTLFCPVRSFSHLARQPRVKDQTRRYCMVASHSPPSAIVTCSTRPSPAISCRFPLFSAVTWRPLRFPAVSYSLPRFPEVGYLPPQPSHIFRRHLLSPTRNGHTSWGSSSSLMVAILKAPRKGQTTLCGPILLRALGSLPARSHPSLGLLTTMRLAWFPIGALLNANIVSQPNLSLVLNCSCLELC